MVEASCQALAICCRALEFNRSTFAEFSLNKNYPAKRSSVAAHKAVKIYNQIPVATAQRTMRFWRVRRQAMTKENSGTHGSTSAAA